MSRKGHNKGHPNYNLKVSKETKKKISNSLKGIKRGHQSEEHKRKLSEVRKSFFKNGGIHPRGMLGKHCSEKTKKLKSEIAKQKGYGKWMKGWKVSEETKKKMSEVKTKDKHPNWKGGISYEPYSLDWTETLKRAIRERDKYICVICNGYGWIIHHIDYNKKNCDSNNLITLCKKCHTKTNFRRDYWFNYFNQ